MKKQCPVCKRTFGVKRSKRHRVHCSNACRYEPKPPEPTWQLNGATIYWSECLAILKQLPSNSVDSIVTDPPAGINFLQKDWDKNRGGRDRWIDWMAEIAYECLRVIKPGGHALVWALPRTSHWTATAWEDAGWELRDRIVHVFATGFAKGVNIPKAIDKALGVEPTIVGSKGKTGTRKNRIEDLGYQTTGGKSSVFTNEGVELFETEPTSEAAKEWRGWHNTLKPAIEDWHMFRKPLDGTLVANVLRWGTGGLNIGACRVKRGAADLAAVQRTVRPDSFHHDPEKAAERKTLATPMPKYSKEGGFPAHLILSDAEEYEEFFPYTKTARGKRGKLLSGQHGGLDGKEPNQKEGTDTVRGHTDEGSATRYFPQIPRICYCPKASSKDKNEGCEELDLKLKWPEKTSQSQSFAMLATQQRKARNIHPTVKPTPLMRWLVKLVTRPGGTVLDPFAGSGSTGKAAALESCKFIGIENDREYVPILIARVNHALETSCES